MKRGRDGVIAQKSKTQDSDWIGDVELAVIIGIRRVEASDKVIAVRVHQEVDQAEGIGHAGCHAVPVNISAYEMAAGLRAGFSLRPVPAQERDGGRRDPQNEGFGSHG
jgi:hypothetical protein